MFSKLLIVLIGLILVFPIFSKAETEAIVYFDLSLAGYRLGMTYDEAITVRQLYLVPNAITKTGSFDAVSDPIYIENIEIDLRLSFKHGKIFKIIGRFSPDAIKEMVHCFQEALGPGENKSKVLNNFEGKEVRQTVHFWDYPDAKMHLVEVSTVIDFATVGLVTKNNK